MTEPTTTNFATTAPVPGSPDVLAFASDTPDINALQQEYQDAWNQDPDAAGRIARAEDIRYTRWPGQTQDGLKHQDKMPEGRRAMPYDRAPDCRVPFVDGTVQTLVDTDYAAFWNARVKTAPATASKLSAAQSAELRQVISWMIHGPLRAELVDQVEFASQVENTIGWVVLHTTWRRKEQLRLVTLNFDQIMELAQQAPPESLLQSAPVLIKDPTAEDEATGLIQTLFPNLKAARARKVVQQLRQDGQAEFPVPDQVENIPEIAVLVPWQDFILPIEATANPGMARCMFRRMFFTEAALRDRAREEEWNKDFVEAACKTKGEAMENGTTVEHDVDANMQLIEIAYAYNRAVDDDDIPGIYCTVLSPHLQAGQPGAKQLYGRHWLVDLAHGEYPFDFLTTEVTGRRPGDARGVPDVLATSQLEMKQQRDATYVFSQLSTTPPLLKKGTTASRLPPEFGPLAVMNNATGQDWAWFPPPPGRPDMAFKIIEDVRREGEDYYGVPRADMPPMRWQPRQQRRVTRNLSHWGTAFWKLAVLAYQNLSPEELASLLGRPPALTATMVCRHRLLFWFDIRAQDPAWVETLLQQITQMVLPADAAGVVDRAKLVQFALAYIDPTLAEEVTMDQAGAKQAMFKQVRDEIGSVMQGNEALYVENDPTAKSKMLFAQQIIGANPDYQMELSPKHPGFNPRKRQLMEKYMKNLQQSAVQQDNKTIGRLGVRPGNSPAAPK